MRTARTATAVAVAVWATASARRIWQHRSQPTAGRLALAADPTVAAEHAELDDLAARWHRNPVGGVLPYRSAADPLESEWARRRAIGLAHLAAHPRRR